MKPAKVFNDPIHGHIDVSDLCVKIIDTPHFQRLRNVGQLGGLYFVFSGASSNRFEHSIGVSHLAKLFAQKLATTQPELNITNEDILCVEIAGLIHDLGHGPFSHLFDLKFLKQTAKYPHFEHEEASIGIFELLIEENKLLPHFHANNLFENDIQFIKELVYGCESEAPKSFKWCGRGENSFLYQIVANKRNGIDVDKFDYFARDCHVLGLSKSFDCHRLMKFARVLSVAVDNESITASQDKSVHMTPSQSMIRADYSADTQLDICFHIKEAWNLFELFHTRYALHKRAYQHKVAMAVEIMICESFLLADPYITVPGRHGQPVHMSDVPGDMHAYWKCSDYLFKTIQYSTSPELQPARDIIQRILTRDLYICTGEYLLSPVYAKTLTKGGMRCYLSITVLSLHNLCNYMCVGTNTAITRITLEILEKAQGHIIPPLTLTPRDIHCCLVKMGYGGKGGKNPVSELTTFFKPVKNNTYADKQGEVNEGAGNKEGYVIGVAPPGI